MILSVPTPFEFFSVSSDDVFCIPPGGRLIFFIGLMILLHIFYTFVTSVGVRSPLIIGSVPTPFEFFSVSSDDVFRILPGERLMILLHICYTFVTSVGVRSPLMILSVPTPFEFFSVSSDDVFRIPPGGRLIFFFGLMILLHIFLHLRHFCGCPFPVDDSFGAYPVRILLRFFR